VKYDENFIYLFIPFFGNPPTGQTRRQIFMLDGSNDADSRKDVSSGGFVDIAPHFGGEIPSQKQFCGLIGVFKQDVINVESFILSKLLTDFNQILHNDRNYQAVIPSGPDLA